MSRIGNYMGAKLTKSRKLRLILTVSFVLGVAITVAEPDLQVLAANVPEIDKTVLDPDRLRRRGPLPDALHGAYSVRHFAADCC